MFFQACTGRKKEEKEKKKRSVTFFMPSRQVWLHQGKKETKKKKKSCINYTESIEITTITIIITLKNLKKKKKKKSLKGKLLRLMLQTTQFNKHTTLREREKERKHLKIKTRKEANF